MNGERIKNENGEGEGRREGDLTATIVLRLHELMIKAKVKYPLGLVP